MSIVLPIGGITFEQWAASLQTDYSNKDVPFPFPEEKWRDWGERLVARQAFSNDQIPNPSGFQDWRSWAIRVTQTLNA